MSGTLLAYLGMLALIVVGGLFLTFRLTRQNPDGSMTRGKKILCTVAVVILIVLWLKLGITGE